MQTVIFTADRFQYTPQRFMDLRLRLNHQCRPISFVPEWMIEADLKNLEYFHHYGGMLDTH